MPENYIFTREKYDSLHTELEHLTSTRRKEVAANLEYAKSLGDLSENAEYQEARAEQAELESRIKTIENLLKYASVIDHTATDTVEVGSTVILKKKGSSSEISYHIVGSEESDIAKGHISYKSPIGTALLGKKKGEIATITIPSGNVEYKIVDVS